MKLFEITIYNNLDYEDGDWKIKLIVVNSKEEAEIRAESWMKEEYHGGYAEPSFQVNEITEVDGFKIRVIKENGVKFINKSVFGL